MIYRDSLPSLEARVDTLHAEVEAKLAELEHARAMVEHLRVQLDPRTPVRLRPGRLAAALAGIAICAAATAVAGAGIVGGPEAYEAPVIELGVEDLLRGPRYEDLPPPPDEVARDRQLDEAYSDGYDAAIARRDEQDDRLIDGLAQRLSRRGWLDRVCR